MDMTFWTTESHMLNYRRILMHGEWSGLPLKYWAPTYGELNLYLRSPYGQNSKYTYVLPTASSIYTYVLPTPHQNKLKSPINPFIRRDIPTTYLLSCNLRRVKSTYRRGKYLRVATLFEPRAGISYEQKYSALYRHGFGRRWRHVRWLRQETAANSWRI